MFQTEVVEKIKTDNLFSMTFIPKSCRLWDNVEKTWHSRAGHRWQYSACALCAGYPRLQTQS